MFLRSGPDESPAMKVIRTMANIAAKDDKLLVCRAGVELALRGHQRYMTFVGVCGRGAERITQQVIMKKPPTAAAASYLGNREGR